MFALSILPAGRQAHSMSLFPEINSLLKNNGVRLSKDFGQHFLIDESVLRAMTDAAKLERSDHVVEIGAGIGVLTRHLLSLVDLVTAIEVDSRFLPLLEEYVGLDPIRRHRLEIVRANALKTPMPTERYKIVANIPYHITSQLLKHAYLRSEKKPESITFLIQKEVAEKICGQERGLLTVMVELFGSARIVKQVPPGAFLPPPKVDSAVVHIQTHREPLADAETLARVLELGSTAFSGRRKMLRRTLGKFHQTAEWFSKASIDPERRPETLSIDEWLSLAKASRKQA